MSEMIEAIVFDWAGTLVDHGSCAPAITFQKIFAAQGIPISAAQARGPMGLSKREHIVAIASLDEVASTWEERHQAPISATDIDSMYAAFIPIQLETLKASCDLIPGIREAVQQCRRLGIKIGSTTGYTRELMEPVILAARNQGLEVDSLVCADDVEHGRPAPDMLFASAENLAIGDMSRVIKVDDTPVGLEAARRAGCWAVGVSRTGNQVGLSLQDWENCEPSRQEERLSQAEKDLRQGGAHFVVESVANIEAVIEDIDRRLKSGEDPLSST